MPWYEPSSSAPRYSGASRNSADGEEEWSNGHQTNDTRNDNEQIISLQDYLDVNWHNDDDNENTNNGSNNYSAVQQQSRITFDSFQHRVEHQLGAAVFPSVASSSFAALNSSLYQTHFNHYHHHHHDSSSHNINGDDNRTATSFSKTAQFFHPRRVMALRQYEGFFSPLDSNFNNCSGAADNSQDEAKQQQSDECSNQHNDRLAVNEAASDKQQHNIQIQPRNLFVSSQTNNRSVNDHHHDNNYSAAAALPIIGNGNYNSSSFHNNSNNYYKRKEKLPFVQATLRQDPTTGQLATSLQHDHHKGRNTNEGRSTTVSSSLMGGKATSWENYGGRPLMDGDNNNLHGQSLLRESGKEHNEKTKAKKKAKSKRKDKSKGKDGGERNEQCIDSIFQRQMGADENDGNADGGGDDGGDAKKKKSKKTKKKRSSIDASCELTIPTDQAGDNSNIMANPTLSTTSAQPTLSEQDFEGMTNTMNAAQCMEGLQQFLSRVGQEPYVAWTMIFLDPLCHYRQYATDSSSSTGSNNNSKRRKKSKKFSLNSDTTATMLLECTTPFLPSNKRYCTDKGPTCTAWNCTCDDQIRAMRGGAPLLGAMFVLNKSDEEGGGEDGGGATTAAAAAEGGRRGKECYLLPLGPTEKCLDDLEAGYSRMKSWPIIPFDCEVSLSDRWR